MLTDLIALAVVALLVGGACAYLVRARRRGVACIGCPDGARCPHSHAPDRGHAPNGCGHCGGGEGCPSCTGCRHP